MSGLAQIIEAGDGEQLLEIFSRAKAARDRYIDGVLNSSE
jgi:prephenate dehydrogenase